MINSTIYFTIKIKSVSGHSDPDPSSVLSFSYVAVHLFLFAVLEQKSSVLCVLLCPNGSKITLNWISKVDNNVFQ